MFREDRAPSMVITGSDFFIGGCQMKEMSEGMCQCGCGNPAPISNRNHKRYGWMKGKSKRFIFNHHTRVRGNRLHYKTRESKRIHRLIVEEALGKPIPKGAVVHHVDGNIRNNSNDNLVLCESHSYHGFIQHRTKAFYACGYANWKWCHFCKTWDDPKNMYNHPMINSMAWHRECLNRYRKNKFIRRG